MKTLKLLFILCIICIEATAQNGDDEMRAAVLTFAGLPVAEDGLEIKVLTNTAYIVGYSESLETPPLDCISSR